MGKLTAMPAAPALPTAPSSSAAVVAHQPGAQSPLGLPHASPSIRKLAREFGVHWDHQRAKAAIAALEGTVLATCADAATTKFLAETRTRFAAQLSLFPDVAHDDVAAIARDQVLDALHHRLHFVIGRIGLHNKNGFVHSQGHLTPSSSGSRDAAGRDVMPNPTSALVTASGLKPSIERQA